MYVISFTATPESPLAVIHSLQVRKYKLREAQTLAKVTQLVRNGAGIPAQRTVPPKLGWALSYFVGKSIFSLEVTLRKSGPGAHFTGGGSEVERSLGGWWNTLYLGLCTLALPSYQLLTPAKLLKLPRPHSSTGDNTNMV